MENGDQDASHRVDVLLDEIASLENVSERVAKLSEVAELYQHELGSADEALIAWAEVLREDPENRRASEQITALADTPERRREVVHALAEAVQHARSPAHASMLYVRLGDWLEQAPARPEDAQAVLVAQLDRAHPQELRVPLLERLGSLALSKGELDEAATRFEEILALVPDAEEASATLERIYETSGQRGKLGALLERTAARKASAEDKTDAWIRAGRFHDGVGDTARAFTCYERARAFGPIPVDLLGKLAERAHAASDFRESAELHRELLDRGDDAHDDAERMRRLYRYGEALRRTRGPEDAIAPFEQAHGLAPTDRNVLTSLVAVYSETKAWTKLVPALMRLGDTVEEDEVKTKYFVTAAGIAQQELAQPAVAAEAYARALRQNPRLDTAFESLLACYRDTEGTDGLHVLLGSELIEELIARNVRALRDDVRRASAYRALFVLYRAEGRNEEAWLAAEALEALGAASAETKAHAAAHRPKRIEGDTLTESLWWTHVAHPDLDRSLTRVLDLAATSFREAPNGSHEASARALRLQVQSANELKAWVFAAIRCVYPKFPIAGASEGRTSIHLETLRHDLGDAQHEELRRRVDGLLESRSQVDLQQWIEAMDLTADRAALVHTRDLGAMFTVVKTGPHDAAAVPRDRRLDELLSYGLSGEYLDLHRQLGSR